MSLLTGPIVIDDVVWGYPTYNEGAYADWRDESEYVTFASRRVERTRPAFRLYGRFTFDALSGADLAQLKGATDQPFVLVLRSRADDDPAWPELAVEVRRTSPVEETGPRLRRVNGVTVYRAVVEFEALETVPEIPGALDGGFAYLESDTVTTDDGEWPIHRIEPWGDATLTADTWVVDVDGLEVSLPVSQPGPEALAALLVSLVGTNVYELDTTGLLRLGHTLPTTE